MENIKRFCEYLLFSDRYIPTSKEIKINLDEKMNDTDFSMDTAGLLRTPVDWDIVEAYNNISKLIDEVDEVREQYKSIMFGIDKKED